SPRSPFGSLRFIRRAHQPFASRLRSDLFNDPGLSPSANHDGPIPLYEGSMGIDLSIVSRSRLAEQITGGKQGAEEFTAAAAVHPWRVNPSTSTSAVGRVHSLPPNGRSRDRLVELPQGRRPTAARSSGRPEARIRSVAFRPSRGRPRA